MTQPTPLDGTPAPAHPSTAPPRDAGDPGPPLPPWPGPAWVPLPLPAARRRRRAGRVVEVLLVVVVGAGLFAGGAAADRAGLLGSAPAAASPAADPAGDELALVREAWKAVHDRYVDPAGLDDRELAYGAIRGLAEAVGDDGHTSFLTPDQAKAVDESLSGSFVGIGIQLDSSTGAFIVADVIPGTPAEEAALQRGDAIVAVDGERTAGRPQDAVVSSIRGPAGEAVTLTIRRPGQADIDVRIVRRRFELPLVAWTMVPGQRVALIRLEQFASGAGDAVRDAIRAARAAGATALVLDLRANPGGYVTEAIAVASQFLADGIVYRATDREGNEKRPAVEAGGLATDLPLAVLADGDTASAAEIVTGAIQDAGRGTVVGERTFGTGTVLGRFDLSDGSSLRIGVERWLTRDGRPIWHEGLDPDVEVALPADATWLRPADVGRLAAAELAASDDAQLLAALELLGSGSQAARVP